MGAGKETDVMTAARFTEGLTGKFFHAYIDGALPPGWVVDDKITAQADPANEGSVVVHVGATSPEGKRAGARIVVLANASIEAVAAELLNELRRKLDEHAQADRWSFVIQPRTQLLAQLAASVAGPLVTPTTYPPVLAKLAVSIAEAILVEVGL